MGGKRTLRQAEDHASAKIRDPIIKCPSSEHWLHQICPPERRLQPSICSLSNHRPANGLRRRAQPIAEGGAALVEPAATSRQAWPSRILSWRRPTVKLPILLLCLCTSAAATAEPPVFVTGETLPSIRVSYADLNLGQTKDVDRLRARVRRAAHSLCFDATRDPLALGDLERTCFKAARANANARIDEVVALRSDMSVAAAAQAIVVQTR